MGQPPSFRLYPVVRSNRRFTSSSSSSINMPVRIHYERRLGIRSCQIRASRRAYSTSTRWCHHCSRRTMSPIPIPSFTSPEEQGNDLGWMKMRRVMMTSTGWRCISKCFGPERTPKALSRLSCCFLLTVTLPPSVGLRRILLHCRYQFPSTIITASPLTRSSTHLSSPPGI